MSLAMPDAVSLARVPQPDLEAYLRSMGWAPSDTVYGGKAQWWRRTDERSGTEYEVLLPLSVLGDYADRVRDLLDRVARAEGREPGDVYEDIKGATVDELKIRIESGDQGYDLPLLAGSRAFQGTRDLLVAAAGFVSEPRRFYPANEAQALKGMLKKIRLGQTQPGSFIITVLSERPMWRQATLFPAPTEEHRIFSALATSLAAVHEAGLTASVAAFEGAVNRGVSANLCSALAKFGKVETLRKLAFGFRWSRLYGNENPAPTHVEFSPQLIDRIREGGEALAEVTTRQGVTLVGLVDVMEHQEDQAGYVTVVTAVEGRQRPVRIYLGREDHLKAIEAYRTQQLIQVTGDLERKGDRFVLTTARNFVLLVPQT